MCSTGPQIRQTDRQSARQRDREITETERNREREAETARETQGDWVAESVRGRATRTYRDRGKERQVKRD